MKMAHKNTEISKHIDQVLADSKAQDVIQLDIAKKSSLCDYLYIATGTSSRHTRSIADNLIKHFKSLGVKHIPIEGAGDNNWVVIDLGDAIVHIFQRESREKYKLEEIWGASPLKT